MRGCIRIKEPYKRNTNSKSQNGIEKWCQTNSNWANAQELLGMY